jgi:exonuclease SbcC
VRVVDLSLRNYRVFEEVDLELPARVIGIFGANGSGKSALVESLAFGLYGRARTRRQEIRTHGVLTDCLVRLVFEHGGSQYEVRRSIRGRNHQTDAELFVGDLPLASGVTDVDAEIQRLLRMDQQVFRASVFAEQKQLDAFSDVTAGKRKEMVLRLLGIRPVDDARSTARKESKATRQRAHDLGAALTDVAQLERELQAANDMVTRAASKAEETASAFEAATRTAQQATRVFEEADRAREKAEKLAVRREGLLERQKATEESRAGLAERLERLEEDLRQLPDLRVELASLEGVVELLRRAERLAEVTFARAGLADRLDALPAVDLGRASDEAAQAESAAAVAAKRAAEAAARAGHAEEQLTAVEHRLARAVEADPSEPCPTCGRALGADFAEYLSHAERELKEAKRLAKASSEGSGRAAKESAAADRARAAASRALEAARKVADERARLAAEADALETEATALRAGFGDVAPDLDVLRFGVGRERDLERKVAGLDQQARHREDTQGELELADAALVEIVRQLEALDVEASELAFEPEAHEEARGAAREAQDALESARRSERTAAEALAAAQRESSGVEGRLRQARETAVQVDELRSAARYLERVSILLDGFRDHLVARVGPELSREAESLFRELTNREYDDLRIDDETLTIRIADGDTYFGVERFSGSETDLANLALRIAISSHLSRVSGADVGLMVLDEVLGSLDAERKDLMTQTLGRLGARFHQLFVITHSEQVKDAFPAAIEVRKVGRRRSEAVLV